jgi:hypothetical protein
MEETGVLENLALLSLVLPELEPGLELFLAGVRSWAGGLQRPCARLIWKLRASSGQCLWTLAGADSGKSVSTPCLAANAVMDEEKSLGIVFLLHGRQPGIVRPPK